MVCFPMMRKGNRILSRLLLMVLCAGITGCSRTEDNTGKPPDARVFVVQGIVRGSEPAAGTAIIEHEEIPGFMPAMTMPFRVKDEGELRGLRAGTAVQFEFVVGAEESWAQGFETIPLTEIRLSKPDNEPGNYLTERVKRLHEGDSIPEFHLVDQDGRVFDRQILTERPTLLTFIFTRCPVPEFCPKMTSNFLKISEALESNAETAGRVRLLSITLDPEYDSPEILHGYGSAVGSDFENWTYATGNSAEIERLTKGFSIYVEKDGITLNHTLCTALINGDGTIEKIWRGNAWKPEDILTEIKRKL